MEAQRCLGYMYDAGEGVEKNYINALKWYTKAADQGEVTAQFNLGFMYEAAKGIQKDINEAVRLYRLSAAQGLEYAKDSLKRLGYSE